MMFLFVVGIPLKVCLMLMLLSDCWAKLADPHFHYGIQFPSKESENNDYNNDDNNDENNDDNEADEYGLRFPVRHKTHTLNSDKFDGFIHMIPGHHGHSNAQDGFEGFIRPIPPKFDHSNAKDKIKIIRSIPPLFDHSNAEGKIKIIPPIPPQFDHSNAEDKIKINRPIPGYTDYEILKGEISNNTSDDEGQVYINKNAVTGEEGKTNENDKNGEDEIRVAEEPGEEEEIRHAEDPGEESKTPIPEKKISESCICPVMIDPVCGTDGLTYPNSHCLKCNTKGKNVHVAHTGACVSDDKIKGKYKISKNPHTGEMFYFPCVCPPQENMVCDSDGQTHLNIQCMKCVKPRATISKSGPCHPGDLLATNGLG